MNNNATIFMTDNSIRNNDCAPQYVQFDAYVSNEQNTIFIEFASDEDKNTKIGISEDIITISQLGEAVYTMIIRKGQKNTFMHSSAFGDIRMSVLPSVVEYETKQDEITIHLVYTLYIEEHEVKDNTFDIKCILHTDG